MANFNARVMQIAKGRLDLRSCYIPNIKAICFMVSEDFLIFSQLSDRPSGHGQVGPHGRKWHNLCRGPQDIAIYYVTIIYFVSSINYGLHRNEFQRFFFKSY